MKSMSLSSPPPFSRGLAKPTAYSATAGQADRKTATPVQFMINMSTTKPGTQPIDETKKNKPAPAMSAPKEIELTEKEKKQYQEATQLHHQASGSLSLDPLQSCALLSKAIEILEILPSTNRAVASLKTDCYRERGCLLYESTTQQAHGISDLKKAIQYAKPLAYHSVLQECYSKLLDYYKHVSTQTACPKLSKEYHQHSEHYRDKLSKLLKKPPISLAESSQALISEKIISFIQAAKESEKYQEKIAHYNKALSYSILLDDTYYTDHCYYQLAQLHLIQVIEKNITLPTEIEQALDIAIKYSIKSMGLNPNVAITYLSLAIAYLLKIHYFYEENSLEKQYSVIIEFIEQAAIIHNKTVCPSPNGILPKDHSSVLTYQKGLVSLITLNREKIQQLLTAKTLNETAAALPLVLLQLQFNLFTFTGATHFIKYIYLDRASLYTKMPAKIEYLDKIIENFTQALQFGLNATEQTIALQGIQNANKRKQEAMKQKEAAEQKAYAEQKERVKQKEAALKQKKLEEQKERAKQKAFMQQKEKKERLDTLLKSAQADAVRYQTKTQEIFNTFQNIYAKISTTIQAHSLKSRLTHITNPANQSMHAMLKHCEKTKAAVQITQEIKPEQADEIVKHLINARCSAASAARHLDIIKELKEKLIKRIKEIKDSPNENQETNSDIQPVRKNKNKTKARRTKEKKQMRQKMRQEKNQRENRKESENKISPEKLTASTVKKQALQKAPPGEIKTKGENGNKREDLTSQKGITTAKAQRQPRKTQSEEKTPENRIPQENPEKFTPKKQAMALSQPEDSKASTKKINNPKHVTWQAVKTSLVKPNNEETNREQDTTYCQNSLEMKHAETTETTPRNKLEEADKKIPNTDDHKAMKAMEAASQFLTDTIPLPILNLLFDLDLKGQGKGSLFLKAALGCKAILLYKDDLAHTFSSIETMDLDYHANNVLSSSVQKPTPTAEDLLKTHPLKWEVKCLTNQFATYVCGYPLTDGRLLPIEITLQYPTYKKTDFTLIPLAALNAYFDDKPDATFTSVPFAKNRYVIFEDKNDLLIKTIHDQSYGFILPNPDAEHACFITSVFSRLFSYYFKLSHILMLDETVKKVVEPEAKWAYYYFSRIVFHDNPLLIHRYYSDINKLIAKGFFHRKEVKPTLEAFYSALLLRKIYLTGEAKELGTPSWYTAKALDEKKNTVAALVAKETAEGSAIRAFCKKEGIDKIAANIHFILQTFLAYQPHIEISMRNFTAPLLNHYKELQEPLSEHWCHYWTRWLANQLIPIPITPLPSEPVLASDHLPSVGDGFSPHPRSYPPHYFFQAPLPSTRIPVRLEEHSEMASPIPQRKPLKNQANTLFVEECLPPPSRRYT